MIINWDDMEKVWHHTFIMTSRKITEIMFEIFEVPAFYSEKSELFSLISSGKRTGLMIQSGHDLSYCVSIFEGEILNDSFTQLNLAGKSITEYLIKLVNQREGYSFTTFGEKEIVRDMKEKICYVALDFEEEMNKHENIIQKDYELPDGQIIQIGKERFQSAECLFQPSLIGIEEDGIHKIAYDAITKTENELRKEVIENIVLTGGTSMFPGFNERLEKEMNQLMEKEEKINVIASPQRKYSVWIGGAIFASRPGFLNLCISSQDYNEFGPTIIHKRKQNNFF
ncbi:actin-7-related [Anaeramoeba ignava]|uniref:Actin-7-related n=1 Tax=Anaeramoeba ignava TaxID=1746090 RepID=A0A9Q0R986_ANAIG|nr:actin-7-related [Anaeramoeba ignava]